MSITTDGRIKFGQSVRLNGPTAMVSVEIYGGAVLDLVVAVFDKKDTVIDGVGFDKFGSPVSSVFDGKASWLFTPRADAAYIKWGVLILRSAGTGSYSVTGKVRDQNGDTLFEGRFSGQIPDGQAAEDMIYDGVLIAAATMDTPKKGSAV